MTTHTCPRCGSTTFASTTIGATGARAAGDALPTGSPGLRCEGCGDRYIAHDGVLHPVDVVDDD